MNDGEGQPMSAASLTDIYDVALLDLDGVVYIGPDAVEHAAQALQSARDAGMRLTFVTNNAARPPAAVADHLTEIGIAATVDEVVTSAQAAARLVAERVPPGSRVLVVGGEGLEVALREQGLKPVSSVNDDPEAVVQGFHPDVGWRQLAEGAYAVASGLPWVASNVDVTIPTTHGIAPGNGTLVDVLRSVTKREPLIAGKPQPPMHRETLLRSGATNPLVVGDRLDTDIEGANNVGADSLLVLTGVATPTELVLAPEGLRPTYLGADLRSLAAGPDELALTAAAERGGCRATVRNGVLDITGRGDVLDAIRAACGAVWSSSDDVDSASVEAALAKFGLR